MAEVEAELAQQKANAAQASRITAAQQKSPNQAAPSVNFKQFAFPDLIKAFHSGDASQFARKPFFPLAYISSVNDALIDQGMLFMMENPKEFLRNLVPNLSIEAQKILATNRNVVNQTTTAGMNMFMGMLKAMADTRRSGGSISDEVAAVNNAMPTGGQGSSSSGPLSYMTIQEVKNQGVKDGRALALLFDESPEDFQKIYRGMIRFVREDVR